MNLFDALLTTQKAIVFINNKINRFFSSKFQELQLKYSGTGAAEDEDVSAEQSAELLSPVSPCNVRGDHN